MPDESDTQALLQAYRDLSAQVGQMNTLQSDVAEMKRQLQQLQGGGGMLEPLSLISGWKESTPQQTPATGTQIGIGQVLLAGPGLTFEKPARTPFLRLKVSGNFMNADYVVDSGGSGNYTTLFGASGALAAAFASGVSKSIWVCATHSETVTTQNTLGAFAAGQIITVASLNRANAQIIIGGLAGAALLKFTDTSPSTAWLQFKDINFYKTTSSDPMFEATSAKTMPNLSLDRVGFLGTTSWSFVVDMAASNTASPQELHLLGCWGSRLSSVVRTTFNTPAVTSFFSMRDCNLPGLVTISQRDTESAPEWGGSNASDPGVLIENNLLTISNYAWKKTYIAPFKFSGNIIFHSGTAPLLTLGSASATTASKNANVTSNHYYGSTVGCSVVLIQNSVGPCDNIVIGGNSLNGPGSGTAITTVASTANCAFEPNSYTGWTTNITGAGATTFSGKVTIAGTFSATIAHSSLTGLPRPADDHTQYALLLGRGTPVGNVFTGYASWGTGAAGYSSTVTGIAGLQAYWRCGEGSGNLADSSGNANTMTANGTPTYGVTGAIVGDSNTAVSQDGTNGTYFEAPNSASLNVGDTFSIVAWIKKAVDGQQRVIISRGTNGYELEITAGNLLQLVKSGVSNIVASTITITGTAWHMVAATKNGATVKLYIDGADVTGAVTNATISATGGVTDIGRYVGFLGFNWNGGLDEIALWNVAITAANITALYNAGTGGAPTPVNTTDGDITGLRLSLGNTAFTSGVVAQIVGNTTGSGYLRVGSNAAPTNTTAGDITGIRVLAGDAVLASGVVLAASSHTTIGGYLRVGAITAPTNVTNGDLTAVRLSVGDAAFSGTAIAQVNGDTRLTGHASIGGGSSLNANGILDITESFTNPSAGTSALTGALTISLSATNSNQFTALNYAIGVAGSGTFSQTGIITGIAVHNTDFFSSGTITVNDRRGFWYQPTVGNHITITNGYGLYISNQTGVGTLTNQYGVYIEALTKGGTLNIGISNAAPTVFTPSATQSIAVSAAIVANATVVQVSTTTAANMTAAPTIADGTDGQVLTVVNVGANTFTLQDQGTLASSNLRLTAAGVALATRQSIKLMYSATIGDWIQITPLVAVL